jgi:predicted transglutaminase-like cysteine proteinase
MNIAPISTHVDISTLLPKPKNKIEDIWDAIKPRESSPLDIYNLLGTISETRWALIQFGQETDSGLGYEKYLQFPNAKLQAVANTIVSSSDNSDEKVYKIEQWVQDNVRYVSDTENYGVPELWSYPSVTVERGTGDCEDGAFLIHSLALHAGVSPDRLRTYGGIVYADEYGLSTGGHAWTAYRREIDDQWVIADWCYWAKDTPLAERIPMADEHKYIDDYFYIEVGRTVETPLTNKVRYAMLSKGTLVNLFV